MAKGLLRALSTALLSSALAVSAAEAVLPLGGMDLNISINERPQYLYDVESGVNRPTPVYITLSVMFVGAIDEPKSAFSLDTFVDVAWRDDRFGPGSHQPWGCSPSTVGISLLAEAFSPTTCICDGEPCWTGPASPVPWSPLLEVTNVAPEFSGMALAFPTMYVSDGAPRRLKLADPSGTWSMASGRFSGPVLKVYDLHDFPYDTQQLDVLFESNAWTTSDVTLIPSYSAEEIQHNIVSSRSMLGWDVLDVDVSTAEQFYPQLNLTYPQAILSIKVARQWSPYSTRYTMVAFFIILMMLFGSVGAEGSVRIGNAIGGFAAILYLQFILASLTPPLNYLSRLDKFLVVSLIIAFVSAVLGGIHALREAHIKAKAAAAEGKKTDALDTEAVLEVGSPEPADSEKPKRTMLRACLTRSNPFMGSSVADLLTYGTVFVAYSAAAGGVLLH